MNTRKIAFFTPSQSPHRDFMKKGRLTRAGGILARKINLYDPQPPKTRSYAEKSTSRWIWLCQKDRIVTIQQLTLVLGRRVRKGAVPLSLIGHIQLLISFTSVPRQVPNRGKQTAAPLSSKRGTGRERSFYIEKAHSARRFPLEDIACCAPCPNKRRKDCVCHRVSNNEDADPHTILNALLVLAIW